MLRPFLIGYLRLIGYLHLPAIFDRMIMAVTIARDDEVRKHKETQ